MQKDAVAIITARGGSKRIPRKNIKLFLGHPIIKYSIEAALNAGCFSEVMVSTDDDEIANIALKLGAKVPFMRSPATSNDFATTADVIEEVLLQYQERKQVFTFLCCIYPTAPFVTNKRLAEAMTLLSETGVDAVLPVTRFSYPIQRALKMEDGKVSMIWPENYKARSQDLMPAYHDCGQFYCLRSEYLLKNKILFAENSKAIEIPESEVQDIDTEEDWKMAEMKFRLLHK